MSKRKVKLKDLETLVRTHCLYAEILKNVKLHLHYQGQSIPAMDEAILLAVETVNDVVRKYQNRTSEFLTQEMIARVAQATSLVSEDSSDKQETSSEMKTSSESEMKREEEDGYQQIHS